MEAGLAKKSVFFGFVSAACALSGTSAFADKAHVTCPTVVKSAVVYTNTVVDLACGFEIKNGGSVNIQNSTVNMTISSANPWFAHLSGGDLVLSGSTFNIVTQNVTADPNHDPQYQLIRADRGNLSLAGNSFSVAQLFTTGFMTTNAAAGTTNNFYIHGNTISNFQGGIYLPGSDNFEVSNNTFSNVSLASIFTMGSTGSISGNIFSFPGNLVSGDAIDVVDSDNLTISDNIIASGVGYGIMVAGSDSIAIDSNKISDGQLFAVMIQPAASVKGTLARYRQQYLSAHKNRAVRSTGNSNITVTNNYMAQNRYGLTASSVDGLTVQNNIFIQNFSTAVARTYWTSNANLLTGVSNLVWSENLYKEAFSQEVPGDNILAKQFVTFPEQGGVIWP